LSSAEKVETYAQATKLKQINKVYITK